MERTECAAIFDMDGTLLDTLCDILCAVNLTMDRFGSRRRTLDEVRTFVGNGASRLIECSLEGGRDNKDFERALEFYLDTYRKGSDILTKPYDGVCELLCSLRSRGIATAVVTNKPDVTAKLLCEKHFSGLICECLGEGAGILRKPARDMIDATLEKLGVTRAVYVGDSEVDVLTAKNAEIPVICVGWGFRDEKTLRGSGADVIVRTAHELESEIIRALCTSEVEE